MARAPTGCPLRLPAAATHARLAPPPPQIFLIQEPGLRFFADRPEGRDASVKGGRPAMNKRASARSDALVIDPELPQPLSLNQPSLVTATLTELQGRKTGARCKVENFAKRAPRYSQEIDGGGATTLTGIVEKQGEDGGPPRALEPCRQRARGADRGRARARAQARRWPWCNCATAAGARGR